MISFMALVAFVFSFCEDITHEAYLMKNGTTLIVRSARRASNDARLRVIITPLIGEKYLINYTNFGGSIFKVNCLSGPWW
jgi:hypothetical protein